MSFLSLSSACFFLNHPECEFLILPCSRCDFLPFYMVLIFQHFQEVPFCSLIFQVCVFFVYTDYLFSSIYWLGIFFYGTQRGVHFTSRTNSMCAFSALFQGMFFLDYDRLCILGSIIFHMCLFFQLLGYKFSSLFHLVPFYSFIFLVCNFYLITG